MLELSSIAVIIILSHFYVVFESTEIPLWLFISGNVLITQSDDSELSAVLIIIITRS